MGCILARCNISKIDLVWHWRDCYAFFRIGTGGLRPLSTSRLSLRWRHNGRDSVSNHQPYDCLLNRLFRRRWKKTSKLCVAGLCAGNSPGTGEFPAQMASNAENFSIWWRHHVMDRKKLYTLCMPHSDGLCNCRYMLNMILSQLILI